MKPRPEDLEKLVIPFFCGLERHEDCEYGSIGLDCKRPFGNSDVEGDVLGLIGAKMEGNDGYEDCWSSGQREYAAELYNELPNYLKTKFVKEWPERYKYLKPGFKW